MEKLEKETTKREYVLSVNDREKYLFIVSFFFFIE